MAASCCNDFSRRRTATLEEYWGNRRPATGWDPARKFEPSVPAGITVKDMEALAHPAAGACSRKFKIILLEDDAHLREMFQNLIHLWYQNIDLYPFENGDDAWLELSQAPTDLLITDGLHPGLHGDGLIRKLVDRSMLCSVLWISGGCDCELPLWLGQVTVEMLPKPFGSDEFHERLNALIGARNFYPAFSAGTGQSRANIINVPA